MKIRTRYAPSPTGFFHVGGARTALYNYLYAKHLDGSFIVRIEDTDVERNVENGTESQLDNLKWLGIIPDESPLNEGAYGPYKQTQKLKRYEQLAMQLVDSHQAYYCFCSKEQLDQDRETAEINHQTPKYSRRCLHLSQAEVQTKLNQKIPHTIRLKVDDHHDYKWNDLIRDEICIPGDAMTDPVILKSNKIAMYNFAVVIDDYDMDITHVLRGEEHISNTPYQIAIKHALKFDSKHIEYGHLSIIVNDQNKKLSKRDTTLKQFIADYQTLGYLPSAVNNFLALMGWAPNDNKEIMSMEELINKFELKAVNKAPAKYDITKLNWVGNQHFKKMSDSDYLSFVDPFVRSQNQTFLHNKQETLLLLKPQLSYAAQIDELIADLFVPQQIIEAQTKLEIKNLQLQFQTILPMLDQYFIQHQPQTTEDFKQMIDTLKQTSQLQGKELFMPIRILCTTKMHGPELAKMLFLLGNKLISHNVDLVRQEI